MRYSEYRNYCICMGIFLSIYGYFLEILSSFVLHDQLDWSNCHIHCHMTPQPFICHPRPSLDSDVVFRSVIGLLGNTAF